MSWIVWTTRFFVDSSLLFSGRRLPTVVLTGCIRSLNTKPQSTNASTTKGDSNIVQEHPKYLEKESQKRIELLCELLNCSASTATGLVMQNKKILSVKEENLAKSIGILKILFPLKSVLASPELMTFQFGVVEQRYHILEEFGVKNVTSGRVIRYKELLSRPAYTLKRHRLIPTDLDPALEMLSHLDLPKHIQTDILSKLPLHHTVSMSMFSMRRHILIGYLCWRLQCTREELMEVVRKYPSVDKHSLQFLKRTIDILIEEFKFSTTKIMHNGFLLTCHPGHLDAILSQVKHLGGMDVCHIGALCPRLLTVAPEQLLRIECVLKEHGVTKAQIQRCPRIYTLCPRTVDARLKELQQASEFAARKSMPRMLNLVYHCSKVAQRIEILAERRHTPISAPITINTLTAATHNFDKVLYSGGDMRCGREAHAFLAQYLDKGETEVRSRLRHHPAAYRAALLNVRKAVELLEENGFTREQIWEGIQVVLYDVELLAQQVQLLPAREELQPFEAWRNEPCLAELLLYFMERDTHFTGLAKMDVLQSLSREQSSPDASASQREIFENLYLHTNVCRKDMARVSEHGCCELPGRLTSRVKAV